MFLSQRRAETPSEIEISKNDNHIPNCAQPHQRIAKHAYRFASGRYIEIPSPTWLHTTGSIHYRGHNAGPGPPLAHTKIATFSQRTPQPNWLQNAPDHSFLYIRGPSNPSSKALDKMHDGANDTQNRQIQTQS